MTFLYADILWLYLIALLPIYRYYQKERELAYKRKVLMLSFVLFLMILAFSRPVLSQQLGDVTSKGTEIVVGIDLSASMKADDIKPTREAKASELLKSLVQSSQQDKFAIVGFTSSAIILSTMTDDKTLLFELFSRLNRNHIVSKSTKLQAVFELANELSLLDKKQLVIFSDGSEGDLQAEIDFANEHHIRVYCVGMATTSGASLYDESGELLVDEQGDIVISALNENLKQLAVQTGGKFFDYDDDMADIIEAIHEDALMQVGHSKELTYIELFYLPLMLAIILFILASTSLLAPYVAMVVLMLPLHEAKASVIDFYHVSQGHKLFEAKNYARSAEHFKSLGSMNWQALFNTGVAFYQAQNYAKARSFFLRIKTKDVTLKATLLYNIANTYAQEYFYKKAAHAYRQSLSLEKRDETVENLLKVAFLEKKLEMFSGRQSAKESDDAQEEDMSSSSNPSRSKSSKQEASSSNSGAGSSQNKEKEKKLQSHKKSKVGLSSKQYQTINKGKYNENNPW